MIRDVRLRVGKRKATLTAKGLTGKTRRVVVDLDGYPTNLSAQATYRVALHDMAVALATLQYCWDKDDKELCS